MKKITLVFLINLLLIGLLFSQNEVSNSLTNQKQGVAYDRPDKRSSAKAIRALKQARINNKSLHSSIFSDIQELGPSNKVGRMRSILIDYENNIFLSGSVAGGLWSIQDTSTRVWTPVNDYEVSLGVTSITQNPDSPNVLYYGTGEPAGSGNHGGGVFKSTDYGQTFSQLSATEPNGATQTGGDFDAIWYVESSGNDTLYVGSKYRGVIRSVDGGDSFQRVLYLGYVKGSSSIITFEDGGVMASMDGIGVYYSLSGDSGTFNLQSNGILFDTLNTYTLGRIQITNSESNPDVVYAQVMNKSGYSLLGFLFHNLLF